MHTDSCHEADIAIIGGGIAGCTLAMALAASYKVILIDKLPEPVERVGESLAPAARRILRRLDLLEALAPQQGSALYLPGLGTRSCWGSAAVHIVDHLRNPDGLAWHLNRRDFEMQLRETTEQRGVQCFWGIKLYNSVYENLRWRLRVRSAAAAADNDAAEISAKFVIDASGRPSVFAKQTGADKVQFDKLVAHWAILPNKEAVQMSTISSGETGWWYSAPVPGNKRVMALHTDPDLLNHDTVKDAAWFTAAAQANKEMAAIIAATEGPVHYCGVVAANSARLNTVAGLQWAAIGDAAMSFDPLSSQGMFNAMAGAMQLSELLLEAAQHTPDLTELSTFVQQGYSAQMDNVWNHYLKHKHTFYSQEQRWKEATFWQRRNGSRPVYNESPTAL